MLITDECYRCFNFKVKSVQHDVMRVAKIKSYCYCNSDTYNTYNVLTNKPVARILHGSGGAYLKN